MKPQVLTPRLGARSVSRIEANDWHMASAQGPGQKVPQQPGLQPSSNDMGRMLADCHGIVPLAVV